jgi:hypothetical protein
MNRIALLSGISVMLLAGCSSCSPEQPTAASTGSSSGSQHREPAPSPDINLAQVIQVTADRAGPDLDGFEEDSWEPEPGGSGSVSAEPRLIYSPASPEDPVLEILPGDPSRPPRATPPTPPSTTSAGNPSPFRCAASEPDEEWNPLPGYSYRDHDQPADDPPWITEALIIVTQVACPRALKKAKRCRPPLYRNDKLKNVYLFWEEGTIRYDLEYIRENFI